MKFAAASLVCLVLVALAGCKETNDTSPDRAMSLTRQLFLLRGQPIEPTQPLPRSGRIPWQYEVEPSLPEGLSIDPATGVVSGTPVAVTPLAEYTITRRNGPRYATTLMLAVMDAPSGLQYSLTPVHLRKDAPAEELLPTLEAGSISEASIQPTLPAGLTLDPYDGTIAGTPTQTSPSTSYTITVSNEVGQTTTTLSITVHETPTLAFAPASAHYFVGLPAIAKVPTQTGAPALEYSVSPALPDGLSLEADGAVSGTPTVLSGPTTYTVTATTPVGTVSADLVLDVRALPNWQQTTPHAAFPERDSGDGFVFDGKMWLSNGYYHGNVLYPDLWSSTDGVEWTRVLEPTPYDGYSSMVVHRNEIYAFRKSVWKSANGVDWVKILDQVPFRVEALTQAVEFNDRIWWFGDGNEVWSSEDGVTWTLATDDPPYGARHSAGIVVFKGRMWLMGGAIYTPNSSTEAGYSDWTTYNDVWSSADGSTWVRETEHAGWSPRTWFSVKVYRDRLWAIAGFDNANNQNLNDVWSSEDGVHWTQVHTADVFSGRHFPTTYEYDGSLWVAAGNNWPVTNDVWKLTLPESSQSIWP